MFSDIVTTKNNEEKFIEIASKLGVKKLYFLYEFDEYNKQEMHKKSRELHQKIDLETGFIVNPKNKNKASQYSKFLAAKSSDKDRFFIESKRIKLIYGFEEFHKRDYLHQSASGLNHILCELAKKNNVAIGFSYSLLFNKSAALTSMLMGRMMQNISLCQKYKVKTIIGSFSENPFEMRAHHDITILFATLGMGGKKINESLMFNL